jgi:aerobic carbon-monoxide dehydrogenase medium subunit
VKPPRFEYHSPASVEEALSDLARLEDAKVLAGGQSLVPLLNFRLAMPAHLVDVNRVAGLDRIYERDGGIAVQALVRQADAEHSDLLRSACPLLPQALRLVAHPVIRNRGTVVGSIVHADPAAEMPAVLLALDGRLRVRSERRGERDVAAGELFQGVFESALEPDELAVEAWFPVLAGPVAIAEESRRHGDFALAGAVRAGGRLALFGVAPTPVLADPGDPTRGLEPSGDLEATPEFRRHLAGVLAARVMAA